LFEGKNDRLTLYGLYVRFDFCSYNDFNFFWALSNGGIYFEPIYCIFYFLCTTLSPNTSFTEFAILPLNDLSVILFAVTLTSLTLSYIDKFLKILKTE
jgi:hypothetical protein